MPRPSLRTRSKKRRRLRLPGGRAETHYRRGNVNPSRCSMCGSILSGVPSVTSSKIRGLSKSQRRPERNYGGKLCARCLRNLLKNAIRST